MTRRLPLLALLLGLAGLVPFLVFGWLAVRQDGDRAAFALVAYGAVILAFLGGVHWGFALQDASGVGERSRLGLGVLPSLAGWVALLLAMAADMAAGLAVLVVTFAAVIVVEARGAAAALVPIPYMRLRYGLTAAVETVLLLILLMRVAGIHIQP